MKPIHAVTGALGYSGRAIAERLVARGCLVRTLTNSPGRPNPFGEDLEIRPLRFDRADELVGSLRGAEVLFNTYWVRFNYAGRSRGQCVRFSHVEAVANTKALFEAAKAAGVRRVVHVSILNPRGIDADVVGLRRPPPTSLRSATSPVGNGGGEGGDLVRRSPSEALASRLSYYAGKAELEDALRETGVSQAILRPGVLFGRHDILVNNIAWVLRHLPVFGLFGGGRYGIRPMHVDDFADLAVRVAFEDTDTVTDAVGPERFEFGELVRRIAGLIGVRRAIVPVPEWTGVIASAVLGPLLHDVVLTRDEIAALTAGFLDSRAGSTGRIRLTDWVGEHADTLGRLYHSELRRRRDTSFGYTATA
ncbi:MAG: NAD(P)H-binding protein [Phycisphaeraceae bacterium]|nr:MAG: NAD(P)H-binding protein [Phycisphaeraceae bacterium]